MLYEVITHHLIGGALAFRQVGGDPGRDDHVRVEFRAAVLCHLVGEGRVVSEQGGGLLLVEGLDPDQLREAGPWLADVDRIYFAAYQSYNFV